MTTNRGQDDELVDLELVDLEPERREQETEERPVMPQNGGQVDELVDLSGGVDSGVDSGVVGVERTVEWPEWRGRGRGVERRPPAGGCDAAQARSRAGA
jgi:hypothetical protein